VGVLVVRLWLEPADESRTVRARITATGDVLGGETRTCVAAGVDEICAVVCGWIGEFDGDGRGDAAVTEA
jgi:hypothetical protein